MKHKAAVSWYIDVETFAWSAVRIREVQLQPSSHTRLRLISGAAGSINRKFLILQNGVGLIDGLDTSCLLFGR